MSENRYVELDNLTKYFGKVKALDGFSVAIGKGELVALLGPSGCGKTTALRALAGLQELDQGKVSIDNIDITFQKPNRRNMGMVFQSYSLFPHMTAIENVEYGLKMKVNKKEGANRTKRAEEMLELVGLSTHAKHFPHQLSGGQQQRVALARALAIEPKVLLLDEPLSALDAKVRTQLRDEIRRIQLELGTTTLFVTHDQEEALSIADRVGVMRHGVLEQIAAPAELYDRPATSFVAEFVGLTNPVKVNVSNGSFKAFGATLSALPGSITSGEGTALIRPESLTVKQSTNGDARVVATSFLGSICRVMVSLPDGTRINAQMESQDASGLTPGTTVEVTADEVEVFVK